MSTRSTSAQQPPSRSPSATARLCADGLSAPSSTGCSQLFRGYRLDDGVLAVEALGQTMMACEDALMDQDTWLAGLLTGSPTVALDADELVLTSADGVTVVTMLDREVADPDRPLEVTRWLVESTISADAVSETVRDLREVIDVRLPDGSRAADPGVTPGMARSPVVHLTEPSSGSEDREHLIGEVLAHPIPHATCRFGRTDAWRRRCFPVTVSIPSTLTTHLSRCCRTGG